TLASTPTTVIKPELGTNPKEFYIQADHNLMGRIHFTNDFKQGILEYNKSIPSPKASYWSNNGDR
ncbi:MAG: 4Fe-4S dicluster domain-containing protein, partial [Desulfomonilaceae bacterium]